MTKRLITDYRPGELAKAQAREVSPDFFKQLQGFGLTTLHIEYIMPDYVNRPVKKYQTFSWQFYDVAPTFPRTCGFLRFWEEEILGPIYKAAVVHSSLIKPAELKVVGEEFRLQ